MHPAYPSDPVLAGRRTAGRGLPCPSAPAGNGWRGGGEGGADAGPGRPSHLLLDAGGTGAGCLVLHRASGPSGRPENPGARWNVHPPSGPHRGRRSPLAASVDIGALRVTVPERTFTAPPIPHPVGLRLGEWATLLGHGPLPTALRPGETFHLTLYWRADGLIPRSYTVFVHLVGPDGRIYAQQDAVPAGWTRPTTGWFPGEVVRDDYPLTVDSSAPPGTYTLRVGWYDPTAGQRVPVLDETGIPLGDSIRLPAPVEVQPRAYQRSNISFVVRHGAPAECRSEPFGRHSASLRGSLPASSFEP